MPIQIVRNDIIKMKVDAIVNPTNSNIEMSEGLSGRILRKAGEQVIKECRAVGGCAVGEAKITSACNLAAKYIIHTVGPKWNGGMHGESILLESCYKNSLRLADEYGCVSIAFPLISSGYNGCSKEYSLNTAINTVEKYFEERKNDTDMTVYIVVYDKDGFSLGSRLFPGIRSYIDDDYIRRFPPSRPVWENKNSLSMPTVRASSAAWNDDAEEDRCACLSLEYELENLDESFSEMVVRKINEKGIKNSDCYKKANIDRKLFSKIVNDKFYKPKKTTAVAFAIALELSEEETDELLRKAGYALSGSDKFDKIIRYVITTGNYRINDINILLFEYDQPLLGSVS